MVALGMGGVGYALRGWRRDGIRPAAAHRGDRRDGAFYMHGMEIHTAIEYRLPVTFVLFDNHAHAMCATREQLFYDDLYSYNRFGPSRLGAGLAPMLPGLPSVDVDDIGGLPTALRSAFDIDGPSVVSIECAADEMPPFGPFLATAAPKAAGTNHHPIEEENCSDVVPALETSEHTGTTEPIGQAWSSGGC